MTFFINNFLATLHALVTPMITAVVVASMAIYN